MSEEANQKFLDLMEDYFAQPKEDLERDLRPEVHYQVGVTLENTEKVRVAFYRQDSAAGTHGPVVFSRNATRMRLARPSLRPLTRRNVPSTSRAAKRTPSAGSSLALVCLRCDAAETSCGLTGSSTASAALHLRQHFLRWV